MPDTIIAALNRHKGFLRGEMGHMIALKFTPELRFVEDKSFAEAEKIETILKSERVQRDLAARRATAMGRRQRRAQPVHGWVVLDKPRVSPRPQAVGVVKRVFDAQKAGHAGTLDPMATGVLAMALGEATKTVPFAMDAEKTYRFTARWGEARDSDDAEGTVTATSDRPPSREPRSRPALPRLHRDHRPDPAGLFGDQGRGRAGL